MNDRCTPATARRLKELGFYQPEAAFGQVWYDAEDNPFLVGNLDSPMWLADAYTYAPTAPDILRELGQSAALLYDQDEFLPGYLNGFNGFIGFLQPHNENPPKPAQWRGRQNRKQRDAPHHPRPHHVPGT